MKKLIFIISLSFISFFAFNQTILMDVDVNQDTIVPKWGKNLRHFTHFYISYGFVATDFEGDGAKIKYGTSGEFTFGMRYKFKLANFYAMGAELDWTTVNYGIDQNKDKTFPNNIIHNKEHINCNFLNLGYYNRFNFDRRGNKIGKFLDLGVYGSLLTHSSHFYVDKKNPNMIYYSEKSKVRNYNPLYIESFAYGVNARLGFDAFVFYAKYRLSNLILPKYDTFPEIPRLTVGMQIGLHF